MIDMNLDTDPNDRLIGLRHARGLLSLHGKDLAAINQQIADVEAEIAITRDRAHAQQVEQRAANDAAYQSEIKAKSQKLQALMADDLADSQTAQEAARTLAAAFNRKLNRVSEMAALFVSVTGGRGAPPCLSRPELERTLSGRLSAVVGGGLPVNCRSRFGSMTFQPGVHKSDADWKELDAATFKKHLNIGEDK